MNKRNFMRGMESYDETPNGNPEDNASTTVDLVTEPISEEVVEMILSNQESAEVFAEEQAENAALDQLAVAIEQLEDIISGGRCTKDTLFMMQQITAPHLATLGAEVKTVSLENFDETVDIETQHKVALEGFMDAIRQAHIDAADNTMQKFVMSHKHVWNAIADRFNTQSAQVKKYAAKLRGWAKKAKDKAGQFKAEERVPLTQLWFHFSTDKGTIKSFNQVFKDVEMTKYVLKDYPATVYAQMRALQSALASCKDTAGFAALFDKVSSMKAAPDLFNRNFLKKGRPYLSVTGLEVKKGSERPVRSLHGKSYPKLAAIATATHVTETWSGAHAVKKVIGSQLDAMDTFQGDWLKFTQSDVNKVIEVGLVYTELCTEYLRRLKEVSSISEDIEKELNRLSRLATDRETGGLLNQVAQYGENLKYAMFHPADEEVIRAIKCAKYNGYLAGQMLARVTS